MRMADRRWRRLATGVAAAALLALAATPAVGADAGQIKTSRGAAWIERAGVRLPATVGTRVQARDVLVTGADGALGVTFADDSLLAIGPDSVLAVERFTFDTTTHAGAFASTLRTGTLAGVSGKLARRSPDAMTVRTPAAILGVRGTEFLVRTRE